MRIYDYYIDLCCDSPRKKNLLEKIRWEEENVKKIKNEKNEVLFRYSKFENDTTKCYFWKQSQLPLANNNDNNNKLKQRENNYC